MSWLGDAWDWTRDKAGDAWSAGGNFLDRAAQGMGLKGQDQSIDLKAASAPVQQKGEQVYGSAMGAAASAAGGPQIQSVTPDVIQAGSVPRISASTITGQPQVNGSQITGLPQVMAGAIEAGPNVTGEAADALRRQRLDAAKAALSAPSAAKATLTSAQGKIGRQMLGVAAGARGADKASARRAAMLGIGANGIQAGADAAALEIQERAQKAQAYTNALAGVQQSDVAAGQVGLAAQQANLNASMAAQGQNLGAALASGQANQSNALAAQTANLGAWTDIAKANQANYFSTQQATSNLELQRQQLNQAAGLQAGIANNSAAIGAFNAGTGAHNAFLNTALQGGGLQNQNLGVQSGYYSGWDKINQQGNAAAAGLLGQGIGFLGGLSDERTKTEIAPASDKAPSLATGYGDLLSSAYGLGNVSNPWAKPEKGQNFLEPPVIQQATDSPQQQGGGLGSLLGGLAPMAAGLALSDEDTKNKDGGNGGLAAWGDKVDPITFRYKPGFADGGERGHIGVSAQQLESTGPLGKALVYKDASTGLRSVNYPELAFAMAVAAKERADDAFDMSKKKKEAR